MITFGGCFAEYVHMNDVNLFDLDEYVKSNGVNNAIICTKLINSTGEMPNTRWGHSASVFEDKLYILGGRNE